jgi:hypothetical protein
VLWRLPSSATDRGPFVAACLLGVLLEQLVWFELGAVAGHEAELQVLPPLPFGDDPVGYLCGLVGGGPFSSLGSAPRRLRDGEGLLGLRVTVSERLCEPCSDHSEAHSVS